MISILLSTYNGSRYVDAQLDSLVEQTSQEFKLYVRDDGSRDNTLEIVKSYNAIILNSDGNIGINRSFFTLLKYALEDSDSEYFMFCDQDDIWKKDKIQKTLGKMKELEKNFPQRPLLIHTDLEVVDENLSTINNSFWTYEKIDVTINSFNKLLMQNTITGCTVMINRQLAEYAVGNSSDIFVHDRWLGLIASYFGKIGIVEEQTILYRQHISNSIGTKGFSLDYFFNRLKQKAFLSKNILQAKAFLNSYEKKLDNETKEMLEDFSSLESKSFYQKRRILLKYKLFKQGLLRNIGVFLKI